MCAFCNIVICRTVQAAELGATMEALHSAAQVLDTQTDEAPRRTAGSQQASAISSFGGDRLTHEEAEQILLTQLQFSGASGTPRTGAAEDRSRIPSRPANLTVAQLKQPGLYFYESPKKQREANPKTDKWYPSGGTRGACDRLGIRRQYGKVTVMCADTVGSWTVKYNQYSMIRHGESGMLGTDNAVLFHVTANFNGATPPPPHLLPPKARTCATMTVDPDKVDSNGNVTFVDFIGRDGERIGVISANERENPGITIDGKSGDFAEWHQCVPNEPAFSEGDVVMFVGGLLTRANNGAKMAGIISRRALVKGSMPATGPPSTKVAPRELVFDTVAYCGQVPVKVCLKTDGKNQDPTQALRPGDVVVTSGRGDGVAVVAKQRTCLDHIRWPRPFILGVVAKESPKTKKPPLLAAPGSASTAHELVLLHVVNPPAAAAFRVSRLHHWKLCFAVVCVLCYMLLLLRGMPASFGANQAGCPGPQREAMQPKSSFSRSKSFKLMEYWYQQARSNKVSTITGNRLRALCLHYW